MKNRVFTSILIALLLVSAFMLSSCDESEPLPEGVSELPDIDKSEMAESLTDENGVLQWPDDLLPEGFPVPEYEEIYSVERVDNEVKIILLAKKTSKAIDPNSNPQDYVLLEKLAKNGYVLFASDEIGTGNMMPAVNKDGWRVQLYNSNYPNEWLKPLAEKYGYAYEVDVRQIKADIPESLFWKFPSQSTKLGYERKRLKEWPADLLPASVPVPDESCIMSMEVRSTGVFIRVKDYYGNGKKSYEQMLYDAGYYQMAQQPHRDKDGNYFYITYGAYNFDEETGNDFMINTYQICPYNDNIIK